MGILDAPGYSQAAVDGLIASTATAQVGHIPWPSGLVAFWPLNPAFTDGDALLSAEGVDQWRADLIAGSLAFDEADPGPFGPSLILGGPADTTCWAVGGIEPDPEDIGALDLSRFGDEFTLINWIRPVLGENWHFGCRFGSHVEGGPREARQYSSYYNSGMYGGRYRNCPTLGAQDGPTPGMQWNLDFASSARQYRDRWVMEASTFDGEKVTAYVDGLSDRHEHYTDPVPPTNNPPYYRRVDIDKNPYYPIYGSQGINPSSTKKVFTIGAAVKGLTPYAPVNPSQGRMSGIAIFNRALSPSEIMQIRMATLREGEPITVFDFVSGESGPQMARHLGWRSIGGPDALDLSSAISTPGYCISAPAENNGHLTRSSDGNPALVWFPMSGTRSTHVRRVSFDLNSTLNSGPQRLALKINGQWWATETTFSVNADHQNASDWSAAESRTAAIDLGAGKWRSLTVDESGEGYSYSRTFKNLVARPSGEAGWSGWTKIEAGGAGISESETSSSPFDRSVARRYTFTTPPASASLNLAGLGVYAATAFPAGSLVSAQIACRPSRTQKLVLTIEWLTASDSTLGTASGTPTSVSAGSWGVLTHTAQAPASAVKARIRVTASWSGVVWQTGDTLDADGALLVEGGNLPPTYFDGATSGGSWTSSPDASSSTKSFNSTGGKPIAIASSPNGSRIPAGRLEAIGFYSPGGSGTHRVRNIRLWRR